MHVITPELVVYHPNTTGNITLIDFPPTIENTSRCDTFVLRNLSSRISNYVVLGELDNEVKCIRVRNINFSSNKLKISISYKLLKSMFKALRYKLVIFLLKFVVSHI